jgi:hypothetical protein
MKSAICNSATPKHPAAVALGRLGGKVTGPSKARSTATARAAANARWKNHKKKVHNEK